MTIEKISVWVSLITGPASLLVAFLGWGALRQSNPQTATASEIILVSFSIISVFTVWLFVQSVHMRLCVLSIRKLGSAYGFFMGGLLSLFLSGFLFPALTLALGLTVGNLISIKEIYLSAGAISFIFLVVAFIANLLIAAS